LIVDRLRRERGLTFRALTADAPDLMTKVARFLAVLELFREGAIAFEQATPLGDLHVRWTGSDDGDIDVGEEFDAPMVAPDDVPVVVEDPPHETPDPNATESTDD
ncbi:MAG: segregation and condensation protein, partial [Nocardioidaceae bacterium]|nr:segregation and condensation protein [Nocardioidaceae bacterium]